MWGISSETFLRTLSLHHFFGWGDCRYQTGRGKREEKGEDGKDERPPIWAERSSKMRREGKRQGSWEV
jgi:hypothetical protein